MASPSPTRYRLSIGDPMPRVTLPLATGGVFDSWDQAHAGRTQVYWLGDCSAGAAAALAPILAVCDAELRVVAPAPPSSRPDGPGWLIDKGGDFARALCAEGPVAVVVDPAGQVAAIVPRPAPDTIVEIIRDLHATSDPRLVQAQAPVLLVNRAIDPELCATLIDHWHRSDKLADGVASASGASVADADIKRRRDVPVDDKRLFTGLRDGLVRRVVPAIFRAFQTRIVQVELPRVGCYDAESGGWFRRHRDNTTPFTAHRQFALSVNLNPPDDYEGGELRFPEFGRQLYRPPVGGAVVFSCALLHEVAPMRRGRRFGLFTFLHDESRDVQYRGMLARQTAKGLAGIRMRCVALWLSFSECFELVLQVAVV